MSRELIFSTALKLVTSVGSEMNERCVYIMMGVDAVTYGVVLGGLEVGRLSLLWGILGIYRDIGWSCRIWGHYCRGCVACGYKLMMKGVLYLISNISIPLFSQRLYSNSFLHFSSSPQPPHCCPAFLNYISSFLSQSSQFIVTFTPLVTTTHLWDLLLHKWYCLGLPFSPIES